MFVLPLIPVLGLVPFIFQDVSTVADRYVYLVQLGTAWAVAFGVRAVPTEVKRFNPRPFFVLGIFALAFIAHVQARAWQNTESIALHSLAVNPESTWMRQALSMSTDDAVGKA